MDGSKIFICMSVHKIELSEKLRFFCEWHLGLCTSPLVGMVATEGLELGVANPLL